MSLFDEDSADRQYFEEQRRKREERKTRPRSGDGDAKEKIPRRFAKNDDFVEGEVYRFILNRADTTFINWEWKCRNWDITSEDVEIISEDTGTVNEDGEPIIKTLKYQRAWNGSEGKFVPCGFNGDRKECNARCINLETGKNARFTYEKRKSKTAFDEDGNPREYEVQIDSCKTKGLLYFEHVDDMGYDILLEVNQMTAELDIARDYVAAIKEKGLSAKDGVIVNVMKYKDKAEEGRQAAIRYKVTPLMQAIKPSDEQDYVIRELIKKQFERQGEDSTIMQSDFKQILSNIREYIPAGLPDDFEFTEDEVEAFSLLYCDYIPKTKMGFVRDPSTSIANGWKLRDAKKAKK